MQVGRRIFAFPRRAAGEATALLAKWFRWVYARPRHRTGYRFASSRGTGRIGLRRRPLSLGGTSRLRPCGRMPLQLPCFAALSGKQGCWPSIIYVPGVLVHVAKAFAVAWLNLPNCSCVEPEDSLTFRPSPWKKVWGFRFRAWFCAFCSPAIVVSLVEDRGLEPLTSCMPCKRSPN
jgi:hypothetical protein